MGKTRGESTCRACEGGHEGSVNNVRFTPNSRHWNPVGQCPFVPEADSCTAAKLPGGLGSYVPIDEQAPLSSTTREAASRNV